MGSKNRARKASTTRPVAEPAAGPPWVLIGGVIVVAALGAIALYPSASTAPEPGPVAEAAAPAEAPSPAPAATAPAAPARQTPKPDPNQPLPPLPLVPNLVPRAPAFVRAAYEFAARNPDILEYVPCFCGCQTAGHQGNADCFVAERNPDGSVREWDTHGMSCTVCIDVARDSMQMHASGAAVRDIRAAIDSKYAQYPTRTPTPAPPTQ